MAELKKSFQQFHECIMLHDSKKENLETSRDANRERVKKHFKDLLKQALPDFLQQGSFPFRTTVNPIDGEYDLDDGVYLNNLPEDFPTTTDVSTVHGWIIDALKEVTKAKIEDKNNCVRLIYANDYHMDFTIYGSKGDVYYLASKKAGWVKNDIRGFKEWFHDKVKLYDEQLRRNIRYLKAWADYQGCNDTVTGILITVLVCQYQTNNERDDQSLIYTVAKILNHLRVYKSVVMPVVPYDNLLAKLNSAEIDNLISQFNELYTDGTKAIAEEDPEKAHALWAALFGDRFKFFDEKKKDKKDHPVPIIITNPPKPWGNS